MPPVSHVSIVYNNSFCALQEFIAGRVRLIGSSVLSEKKTVTVTVAEHRTSPIQEPKPKPKTEQIDISV
jgi:hypothetical protein